MNALKTGQARCVHTEVAGVRWDSYWIPVEGAGDYFVHFTNGINESVEKARRQAAAVEKE
jgi:hypothetical protein